MSLWTEAQGQMDTVDSALLPWPAMLKKAVMAPARALRTTRAVSAATALMERTSLGPKILKKEEEEKRTWRR